MTDDKCSEVLDRYEARLKRAFPDDQPHTSRIKRCNHLLRMIPQMRLYLVDGRREKFMRWLGFLQGSLWMLDIYSIEEMMEYNRPDEGDHDR